MKMAVFNPATTQKTAIFIDCVYDLGVKIPSSVGTSWNYFGNTVKHREALW
jgi:hypothetical protein